MASEYGITLIHGTIRECYGPSGELYCLPIYVINLPTKFGTENDYTIPDNAVVKDLKVIFGR